MFGEKDNICCIGIIKETNNTRQGKIVNRTPNLRRMGYLLNRKLYSK